MAVKNAIIMLRVSDMDRAVTFYRDGLGLSVKMHQPFWSELTLGEQRIALHPGGDGARRDSGINFGVDELEADCARCAAAGAIVEQPPQERPREYIKIATLRDPEGNVFYLVQPLGDWAT